MSSKLLDILSNRPQDLLIPNEDLKHLSLDLVKNNLDRVAKDYSIFEEIYVDGLDAEQVWAQAEMVINGVVEKVMGEEIPDLVETGAVKRPASEMEESDSEEEDDEESVGFESELENEEAQDAEMEEDQDDEEDDEDDELDVDMENLEENDDYVESGLEDEGLEQENELEEEDEDDEGADEEDGAESTEKDAFGLNDGIFNLEDFQSQVLAMEQGEDEEPSDDNIDYLAGSDGQDSDPEQGDSMKFNDFFAPPKKTKKSKFKAPRRNQIEEEDEFAGFGSEPEDEAYEEVMDSVRKDLFADEDDKEQDDESEGLSKFEKQQKEMRSIIEELESANVAPKKWEVSGEAKAKDRPQNSLIEAELDFERSAKPVPIITQDSVETLEEMIRRRIRLNEFDELSRKIPTGIPEFQRSKLVDVQETKSQKSLAELYEEDQVKRDNPDTYVTAEQEQQDSAHKEIKDLWQDLSRKLDTLSSWTYTPKAPKPSISIVANTAAIAMEEAQPTAMATEATLAPQEVYRPETDGKREVVGHSGLPVAKSEMTREERKRERRKHKAKRTKVLKEREETQRAKAQNKGSRADVMETLKKGNVTIIDKKGEKRDLSGKLKKDHVAAGGSRLKL